MRLPHLILTDLTQKLPQNVLEKLIEAQPTKAWGTRGYRQCSGFYVMKNSIHNWANHLCRWRKSIGGNLKTGYNYENNYTYSKRKKSIN